MNITDEQLMAYADGEADEALRHQIEAAIERDPSLAARVEEHRQLRAQLQDAFAPVLNESPPDRLLGAISAPLKESASITDLHQKRNQRKRTANWSWHEWGAMAASVVLGVFMGQALLQPQDETVIVRNGELIASGTLAQALDQKLSNEAGELRIGMTFRSNEGEYCRAFVRGNEGGLAGFACRAAEDWRVRVLSETQASSTEYELAASGLPPVVLNALDQAIEGEPLTVEEERAARAEGWR